MATKHCSDCGNPDCPRVCDDDAYFRRCPAAPPVYVNAAACCGPCGKVAANGTMPSYMILSDGRAVCYECSDEAIRRTFTAATPDATRAKGDE